MELDFDRVVWLNLAGTLWTAVVAHAVPFVGPLGATLGTFVEVSIERFDFRVH